MNLKKRSALYAGLLIGAAFSTWPLVATAQQASSQQPVSAEKKLDDETVVLSPFNVTSEKDRGYAATNAISGSRVNTAIKDIPIPIQVITSEFINDIGATDLRRSLSYVSGITLQSQNDLENKGGTFGSPYGPGGVNNPEGVTANINGVQLKIRGFITNNVLRNGFLRGSPSDAVNIDRIEVVQGPNALLYGTGNFGGVVDYLTKRPQNRQQGFVSFSYGTYDFMRATLDVTGPLSTTQNIDYRVVGSWESSETSIDFQKNSHYFIAPSFSWKPTKTTEILVETEYSKSKSNGYGFRALRAAQGTAGTPINNDQLEAVSFFWPPGVDKKTFNLSGPNTFNDQQQSNIQLLGTQQILKETEFLPRVDFLVGYNRTKYKVQTQDVNGGISGPIASGAPGFALSQTITLTALDNGIDGRTPSNGNLAFGTFPNSVVRYTWNQNNSVTTRDQERVELTADKTLFADRWFKIQDQVLGGYSELFQESHVENAQTVPALYSYKGPLDTTPIVFGKQGDGTPSPALYKNNINNINKGWDRAFYVNNYFKFLKFAGVEDRIILMNGVRRDVSDKWSTNTTFDAPGGAASLTESRALQTRAMSRQNGVMVKITKDLSVFALKASGFQPNFGGLRNAETGAPVGADTARSKEIGIKFDFLNGKISGTISHYKIKKSGWAVSGFSTPAPLGHLRFDPTKPIVYNLNGGFNGAIPTNPFPGYTGGSQGAPIQTDPAVQAKWNAAVAAGAVTLNSPLTGNRGNATSLYLNASNPAGAAYLDEAFASIYRNGGNWPGWLYQGNSDNDNANINNATEDDSGFQNTSENAAWAVQSEARGWDGTILFTPNDQWQVVVTGSVNNTVKLLNKGTWLKYPYPQDRWATWYFPNGGFGLGGQTLAEAYTDPTNTATRTNTGTFPGDDTPKNRFTLFTNYKFAGSLKGLTVGLGGDWQSKRAYFSGVTHGSGQTQTDTNGQAIVVYAPSQLKISMFAKKEWKSASGHAQYVQLNVDNVLNDQKVYGLIYNPPITAKLTYGIGF